MFPYRKSSLIVAAVSVMWLVTSLAYSMGNGCTCCSHNETHGKHHGKTHAEKCCSPLDDFSNNCQCECISCSNSRDNDIVSQRKFIPSFEKDELSGLTQLSSEVTNSLRDQGETDYQDTSFPLKFLSLYLIKASFLL